jgi:hypothetical protein
MSLDVGQPLPAGLVKSKKLISHHFTQLKSKVVQSWNDIQ